MRDELGCERVVLVGNSGGAALAAYYQAEAERFSAETMVDGDPTHIVAADLPPVDGLALCAAHEGRSHLLLRWIDPSLVDEHDGLSVDAALDIYDPANWADGAEAPPRFDAAFLTRFTTAQRARRDRIERRVRERLAALRATPRGPRDEAFVVYRTHADPRCLDLSLDANDRRAGSVWGDARSVNYSANAMGRTTSLTAFLSQWSSASRAGGPENLAKTSVPALLLTYTADQSTFPSTRDAWLCAGGERIRNVDIVGGDHYLAGRTDLQMRVADEIAAFAETL
jgi:pimeloyl-ACP methyl ester carboxylesterase